VRSDTAWDMTLGIGGNFNPRSYVRSDRRHKRNTIESQDFNPRSYVRSDQPQDYLPYLCNVYFNPRSYVRSDSEVTTLLIGIINFNPRSYVRSDIDYLLAAFLNTDFNPRSYVRSDLITWERLVVKSVFQSTLLREERLDQAMRVLEHKKNFNPRSYVRSDSKSKQKPLVLIV